MIKMELDIYLIVLMVICYFMLLAAILVEDKRDD